MRKDRLYIAFLVLSVFVYAAVELAKPEPVDWSPDFTKSEFIPYSSKILYEELDAVFPYSQISENNSNLFDIQEDANRDARNWVFINSSFGFDEYETDVLLQAASAGDHVFLAGIIAGPLGDSLGLRYRFFYSFFDSTSEKENLHLLFNDPGFNTENGWNLSIKGTFHFITSYDSARTKELGSFDGDYLNFVEIQWGDGKFLVNTTPFLFTNYYLRTPGYATYAYGALSHLPDRPTVWDNYYKDGKQAMATPMYAILNSEALKYAWFTAVISVFLFMLFRSKRRQRIIPVLKSPENSSIRFAETIGQLYQEQGSHKDILEKKTLFFFDYIKTNLRLDTTEINEQFREDVAIRSGINKQEIIRLFDLLELVKNSQKVTDNELKLLTDQIDQFYKNSQR